MSVLTGKQFNEKYRGKTFIKLTNQLENHHGFQFQTGWNIDKVAVTSKLSSYPPCGIYFCQLEHMFKWLSYGDNLMYYIRSVTLPDNAKVEEYDKHWRADRIILGERLKIADLEIWDNKKICSEAIKENVCALRFVKDQTIEICLEAIKQNSYAIQYVKDQTERICSEAIKKNPYIIEYVRNQTAELCMEAVKNEGLSLKYVENKTPEICLAAVSHDGRALEYVKDQTHEICLAAVKENYSALKYVKDQTEEMCLIAVKQEGYALLDVKNQTPEICLEAIKQNRYAVRCIRNPTDASALEKIIEKRDIQAALEEILYPRNKKSVYPNLKLSVEDDCLRS